MKRKIFAMIITLAFLVNVMPVVIHAQQTDDDCITFSSSDDFSLMAEKGWDGTMEYSIDKATWNTWTGSLINAVLSGDKYYIYVRGNGNTIVTGSDNENDAWKLSTTQTGQTIDCTGNIETLRGAEGNEESATAMATACYRYLFANNTALKTAPALPATTLADFCYAGMFKGCTALTKSEALPATILKFSCYNGMFKDCTALTEAPALPATTLASNCYNQMFLHCTALTKAPALLATNLEEACYGAMFGECSALKEAPALPAETLAYQCYAQMFYDCTSLEKAPALPATTLEIECYYSMFKGCTALTEAPALPAKVLKAWCYEGMFDSCTSLKKPADLSHVTTIESYFNTDFGTTEFNHCGEMYVNCNSLKIYTVPTDDCKTPWLCTQVEGQKDSDWLTWMFNGTVGDVSTDLNGNVKAGVTYYILSDKTNNVADTGVRGTALCAGLSAASLLGLFVVIKRNTKRSCQ